MKASAVRSIQIELQALGYYVTTIDGNRGPATHTAVVQGLESRSGDVPYDWIGWSDKRKCIAYLQLLCRDHDIDPGAIDGWWGPQTDYAFDELVSKQRTGALPEPWRDSKPPAFNPHGFPLQDQDSLLTFYGRNGEPDGNRPPLVKVPCPWKLRIAWNMRQTRSFLWCHERVASSLGEILEKVHEHYGTAEIRNLHLDRFGGDYSPRRKRGGTTWSTHAWGIAIDWDPTGNKYSWGPHRAAFAKPAYRDWWEIWEQEGWTSLGRSCGFDWMHVQAAKL